MVLTLINENDSYGTISFSVVLSGYLLALSPSLKMFVCRSIIQLKYLPANLSVEFNASGTVLSVKMSVLLSTISK